jgi:hypothetical protein
MCMVRRLLTDEPVKKYYRAQNTVLDKRSRHTSDRFNIYQESTFSVSELFASSGQEVQEVHFRASAATCFSNRESTAVAVTMQEERQSFSELYTDAGWIDVFRQQVQAFVILMEVLKMRPHQTFICIFNPMK